MLILLVLGLFFLKKGASEPMEAPEAEQVLSAQAGLPFQVLIPAYLPGIFDRNKLEIHTGESGPGGEAMIQLVYITHKGNMLTLSEWIPNDQDLDQTVENVRRCRCICRSPDQCELLGYELTSGPVHIRVELSLPNLLSQDQMQFVLDTLGPAANQQVYSSMKDVPLSFSAPPAEAVAINEDGVQEVTLVVTPQGYTPVHFAVKKDVPVRLIFRQLGEVGCGNELVFDWGSGESADLLLASPGDKQVLEFTPTVAGDFLFHCPHQIYRGVMTVEE